MATKTLTPSACPVTGNNAAGMPVLQPSADVCQTGGGGGTDFIVAGPVRVNGNYDGTVGDGDTVDSFAEVGARDGNTIVKQAAAAYVGSPQSNANWHIDGVGVADTAVYVGVATPTIAATALEAQGGGDVVAYFQSNLPGTVSAAHSTVVIRKSFDSPGGSDEPSELQIQDSFGTYYFRASIGRGSLVRIARPKSDRFENLLITTDLSENILFGVSYNGAIFLLDATTGTGSEVMGQATLSGGTATVATTNVSSNSRIFLTYATGFTNAGILKVGTIVDSTSFVINSSDGSDANKVNWFVLNSA